VFDVEAECLPLTKQDKNDIIFETKAGVTL
jgi:hypothetical protein